MSSASFPPSLALFVEDVQDLPTSPDIGNLFKCNDFPTEKEEEAVNALASESQSLLSHLSDKISTAKSLLMFLQSQQEKVEALLRDIRTLPRSIRHVPDDVLGEIFALIAASSFEEGTSSLEPLNGLWAISQVCQQWRDVAMARPLLWSSVSLSLPVGRENEYRLGLVTERSKMGITSVDLTMNRYPTIPSSATITFFKTSPRWTDVQLRMPSNVLYALAKLLGDAFRPVNTEKLTLMLSDQQPHSVPIPLGAMSSLFLESSQLKILNTTSHQPFLLFPMPGHNITFFRATNGTLADHLYSISLMPNLRTLIIHLDHSPSNGDSSQVISLKRLRTLHIFEGVGAYGDSTTRATDLFPFIYVPVLKRLILDINRTDHFPRIRPSPTKLTTLRIIARRLSSVGPGPLLDFLGRTKNLKRLSVSGIGVPADLVRGLTYNPTQSNPLVPQLKYMHFNGEQSSTLR